MFICIYLRMVYVALLHGAITEIMNGMLYVSSMTIIKVVMNFMEHGGLLNDDTCIK